MFADKFFVELTHAEANEILLKLEPVEKDVIKVHNLKPANILKARPSNDIQTIMVYHPPPAKGGGPINTENYSCLGEVQFLNDVIIDFYLKYLTLIN